jgi:hypothetical protein
MPEQESHTRIEDTVLVTATGTEVLHRRAEGGRRAARDDAVMWRPALAGPIDVVSAFRRTSSVPDAPAGISASPAARHARSGSTSSDHKREGRCTVRNIAAPATESAGLTKMPAAASDTPLDLNVVCAFLSRRSCESSAGGRRTEFTAFFASPVRAS